MAERVRIDNPVVEQAMIFLSEVPEGAGNSRVNRGSLHPNDTDKIIYIFKQLHDNNESYSINAIEDWALGHGWNESSADLLRCIVQLVADGVDIRAKVNWWPDIITKLRERV